MKTEWFDKYTRPHWIGVYPTRVDENDKPLFNHWNGYFWERPTETSKRKESSIGIMAGVQNIEWRGFTKEQ